MEFLNKVTSWFTSDTEYDGCITTATNAYNVAKTTCDNDKKTREMAGGSRRRRRRCTKKHTHSSACKRKSKGKRTKGRKRR